MKKILLTVLLASTPFVSYADISINLDIETPSGTAYHQTVAVAPCSVTNDPATTTTSAKCALEQAGANPQWTNYGGDDWFLTEASGASQDFAQNLYWGWWSDMEYGQTALNKHDLHDGETLLVALGVFPLRITVPTATIGATTTLTVEEFGFDQSYNGIWSPSASSTITINDIVGETDASGHFDFMATSTEPVVVSVSKTNFVATSQTFTPQIAQAPAPSTPSGWGGGGGGVSAPVIQKQFNMSAALSYLTGKQHPDGSFGAPLLSDWAAIAFSSQEDSTAKTKLREYLRASTLEMATVTDHERRAMALMTLGINPQTGTQENQIAAIAVAFDGTQIGDPSRINDDIFAILPLLHSGYNASDPIVTKTTTFIVSKQSLNGSWNDSVDLTAAAIQALAPLQTISSEHDAIIKAVSYLHAQQKSDGGLGNSFSTSWALQTIAALDESLSNWQPSASSPQDYLASVQQSDGGIEPMNASIDTRIWATAYAIPAMLGKTWDRLLPVWTASTTSLTATTSPIIATSTLAIATSTPPDASTIPTIATTTSSIDISTSTPVIEKPARKHIPRIVAKTVTAATSSERIHPQIAGVANTLSPTILISVWHAVTSFFSRIF